jgi:hypothetical protein
MKAFSFLFIIIFFLNSFIAFSQKEFYVQANVNFFTINKYGFNNSDILTGKGNAFEPTFGNPQLIFGYKLSDKSAVEIGVIYRINTFNFESNSVNTGSLISLDIANSIGVPIRYRYYLNEFLSSNKFRFSLNGGVITLFQNDVNIINQSGQRDVQSFSATYKPYTTQKSVFIGELGFEVEKRISGHFNLSFDYNYWLGEKAYAVIDLTFKNNVNNTISTGSITHSGTSHNLSIGLKYTFGD